MYPGQQGFNAQQHPAQNQQQGVPAQFQPQQNVGYQQQPFVGQPQQMQQPQFQQQPFVGQSQMQPQFPQQQFQQMPQGQFQQPVGFVGQPNYGGQPAVQQGFAVAGVTGAAPFNNVQQAAQFAQQQANALAQQQMQAQMQAQQLQQQPQYQQQSQLQQQNQLMQQQMNMQQQLQQAQQQVAQNQTQLDAAKEKERERQAKKAATLAYQQGLAIGAATAEQKNAELANEKATRRATVHDAPDFDPVADATALRKAMKGLGCDKDAVARIIGGRSNRQRQEIIKAYKETIKRDLIKDLKSELRGNLESLVKALMRTPASYDASELKKAMKGYGCNEEVLIEILCTRSPAHLENVKAEFRREYKTDMVDKVSKETTKHIQKSRLRDLLNRLLNNPRDPDGPVDISKAQLDAKLLFDAGENKLGTDQAKFIEIFASRSLAHLAVVFVEYRKICDNDISKSIEDEMNITNRNLAKALQAIVGSVRQLDSFFANKLRSSMKGRGTKERLLIRVVVSRSEIDLADISDAFAKDPRSGGESLSKWIKDDTSGHFKELLLQLIDG